MQIKNITTWDFTQNQIESYTTHFNKVFNKNFTYKDFQKKYTNNNFGFSFHSLLINNKGEVVGGCTVIPFQYSYFDNKLYFGLAVDVFIDEEYRKDPLSLYKMYKGLRKALKENGIVAVIAIPNETVYNYWKNIVKWKDIAILPTYVFPINLSNLFSNKFMKFVSRPIKMLYNLLFYLNLSLVNLKNLYGKSASIYLIGNNNFYEFRYNENHKVIKENFYLAYSMFNESNIKVAYILDYYNKNGYKDLRSLLKGVKYIKNNNTVDSIVYIGKFFHLNPLFIKVPNSFSPRLLRFTCDILDENRVDNRIYYYANWDFGLINFDVR